MVNSTIAANEATCADCGLQTKVSRSRWQMRRSGIDRDTQSLMTHKNPFLCQGSICPQKLSIEFYLPSENIINSEDILFAMSKQLKYIRLNDDNGHMSFTPSNTDFHVEHPTTINFLKRSVRLSLIQAIQANIDPPVNFTANVLSTESETFFLLGFIQEDEEPTANSSISISDSSKDNTQ
jgi:hypothetical protein